jgi:hypothetical protein
MYNVYMCAYKICKLIFSHSVVCLSAEYYLVFFLLSPFNSCTSRPQIEPLSSWQVICNAERVKLYSTFVTGTEYMHIHLQGMRTHIKIVEHARHAAAVGFMSEKCRSSSARSDSLGN